MRNTKTLKYRILSLYIAFFAVMLAGILFGTIGSDFSKGMRDGKVLGMRMAASYMHDMPRSSRLLYELPNDNPEMNVSIPGLRETEGRTVSARINKIDLLVEEDAGDRSLWALMASSTGSVSTQVYAWLLIGCYAVIIIYMLLIMNSLRKSFRSESVFDRRNILRTRIIGIVIIGVSVLQGLLHHTIVMAAADILDGSSITLNTTLQIDYWNMLMGILILFIAEVFAIGYDMSEEQKLTI